MYVKRATWLENGPRPRSRGMGDCLITAQSEGLCPDGTPYLGTLDNGGAAPGANPNSVTVTACSPDMCFGWPFPWVGTRNALPPGGAPMGWADSKSPASCYCQPIITVPSPWGAIVTGGLALLLGIKVVRGVMG